MSNNKRHFATPQEEEAIRAELERRRQVAPDVPYLAWKNGQWEIEYQKPTFQWDSSWRLVILSK